MITIEKVKGGFIIDKGKNEGRSVVVHFFDLWNILENEFEEEQKPDEPTSVKPINTFVDDEIPF